MIFKYYRNTIIIIYISFFFFLLPIPLNASQSYLVDDLYIIQWGEQTGDLSNAWNYYEDAEGDFVDPPDRIAISENGNLVIKEYNGVNHRLQYFSNSGSLIAATQDIFKPDRIAISFDNKILMSRQERLMLMDSDFNILRIDKAPSPINEKKQTDIYGIFPSNNNTFWILYYIYYLGKKPLQYDIYLGEFGSNGFCSDPTFIHSGENTTGYIFVTPYGEVKASVEDMYGYKYEIDNTPSLYRYSPSGGLVFNYTSMSDPGWTEFDDSASRYLITWSGDFYTIRATDEGAVVTKFRLNVDPICSLVVVTLIPLQPKPAPFAVEFDASGTTDPNGDELSYEWSFDGDLIFNEPVDDAYTGDPDHPTHLYYEDYNGPVIVRVKDPYDGECQTSVTILIDIE